MADVANGTTITQAAAERERNIFEKLWAKAFRFESEVQLEPPLPGFEGKTPPLGEIKAMKVVVADQDLADVYRFTLDMREALMMCRSQFLFYAELHKAKRTSHMSLVETQELQSKIERNEGIARSLVPLINAQPQAIENWRPISTAPQDGSPIRVLGRKENGQPYIETTYWWNIQWAIQLMHGYLPPTHWKPLEELPKGY